MHVTLIEHLFEYRFGLPLVLFTAIDNHGITNILGGCLISDERCDSYVWCLQKFQVQLRFQLSNADLDCVVLGEYNDAAYGCV